MFDPVLALKLMIPGYRARWVSQATVFLRDLDAICAQFQFEDGEFGPIARRKDGRIHLHGVQTPPKDLELFKLLQKEVPSGLSVWHFRLARDLVTRYMYPHLRPDLTPVLAKDDPPDASALVGFHGQQKDGVDDIADNQLRMVYRALFAPSETDIIIDCGAFIGIGAAAVAPLVAKGRLIALEADARNVALLARNTLENGLDNVDVLHRAIWKHHGQTLSLATGEAQANTLRHDVFDGGNRQPVQTVTIDGLVTDFGFSRVDMLSFTVNGAEVEALEGARETLLNHRPRVRLAGWYRRGGQTVADLCRPLLEQANYHVHVGPKLGVLALPRERLKGGGAT
ncbi:MAG: FkbM family methyltransferase [Alphaproteobacteria bacterium]|nr:FkbM family methyltransferase [Alphaproteobacteria bacterium]